MNLLNLARNARHFLDMRVENDELPVKVYDQDGKEWDVVHANCSYSSYNLIVKRVK